MDQSVVASYPEVSVFVTRNGIDDRIVEATEQRRQAVVPFVQLVDTFCIVEKGELWVKNMYIAEYFYGTYNNHNARRDRKLLLTKKELRKIEGAVRASGFTIVPTRLFINEKGLAKVVVAIARGKKEYDKRDSIRERDDRREMDRAFKR